LNIKILFEPSILVLVLGTVDFSRKVSEVLILQNLIFLCLLIYYQTFSSFQSQWRTAYDGNYVGVFTILLCFSRTDLLIGRLFCFKPLIYGLRVGLKEIIELDLSTFYKDLILSFFHFRNFHLQNLSSSMISVSLYTFTTIRSVFKDHFLFGFLFLF
jgi:hypothetical protein